MSQAARERVQADLDRLRGQLVVSCQAREENPLHGPIFMAAMAKAAVLGGAAGIRADGVTDVSAIRASIGPDHPIIGIAKVKTLTGFSLMFAVLTLAVAALFFQVEPSPLQPALNSYWIKIHVVAAISGSSLFAIGGIATILFLVKDRSERRALAELRERPPAPIMGGAVDVDAPHDLLPDPEDPGVAAAPRRGILPSAAVLDRVAYRAIAFAFPIWTFAVIAGALWAQDAWGRYWGWDPKETWSFVTWTIFAGYLHSRSTAGWKGRKAAWIAVVGFASLLITYYAVNLWIVGLHSYARG